LAGIFLFLILVISLPLVSKKYFSRKYQDKIGQFIGIVVGANYCIWLLLEILAGTFDIKIHLPFQLCRVANILIPFIMIYKNDRVYQIIYFWGMSGVFQGLITPDIINDFPHFHFFRFWVAHDGMIIALVYATAVYGMRPKVESIKSAFIALNLFLLVSLSVNFVLDANYFWICGKPPMRSLLDYLGPWPWYIIAAEFVAILHFLLAYLPFYILSRKEKLI
tara:strand:+ start:293 stop:955 length:663 start_codon:yes stop_codon:yes gene_type:complete